MLRLRNPLADFTPVSRFATSPMVLIGSAAKTPAAMPEPIAAMIEKLTALGAEPVAENAASFDRFIEAEQERADRVVAASGIKPSWRAARSGSLPAGPEAQK